MNKAQDSWSQHEQIQHQYWEILASSELNEVAAVHWVDENDAPISLQMFKDVAAYSLQKSKLDVNGIRILEIGCGNGLLLRALDEVLSKDNGEYSLLGQTFQKVCWHKFHQVIVLTWKLLPLIANHTNQIVLI